MQNYLSIKELFYGEQTQEEAMRSQGRPVKINEICVREHRPVISVTWLEEENIPLKC